MTSIIVEIITGIVSIVVVIISSRATRDQVTSELKIQNEVQNVKIENLTKSVEKHNAFGERIPVIETKISSLEARVKELERNAHS